MTHASQRIDGQAAEWAVRMHAQGLTPQQQTELDRWLEQSPRHAGALLRARAAWTNVDRLAALAGDHRERQDAQPARPRWVVSTLAASAILVLIASASWFLWPGGTQYATAKGSIDSVALADGSRVTLNADSRIQVLLEEKERRVRLDQGEALFVVAKDPSRPFVVHAGTVSVRAVGTAFSVRTAQGRVDVAVTEGVVELVDENPAGDRATRRIAANEHATVIDRRQVEIKKMTVEDEQRTLAWLDRTIDFEGQSLAAAVAEINRHNTRQIAIDDASLARSPVIGVFRANDPDGFAATVAAALGIESVDHPDAIHLRQRSAP